MKLKLTLSIALSILVWSSIKAQYTITIDQNTQRFIGDVSTLNRDKYTNAHILFNDNDSAFETFKKNYNINPDYIGGRQFWNPLGMVKNGNIPNVSNTYDGVREVTKGLVATGGAGQLMWDDAVDYSAVDITTFSKDAAAYVAKKYRDDWALLPEYIEPFNEPMVHAIDYYPEGKNGKYIDSKLQEIYNKISEYHQHLGEAIHNTPELKNMKVMGFASAYPEFESNDFKSWNTRYKNFIDIAGKDLDAFSLHIYDGSGINNSGGRRSGSNTEAILDIIETYSLIALGEIKPYAITEYGRLVADQQAWINDKTQSNYETVENAQAVRSQLHMVMSFMERTEHLLTAIPFNVNTRNTSSKYCKSSIWLNNNGKIETTNRVLLYEMLKDLKGERVWIHSDNVNIQTQAFVSGNELYVMLNNLDDASQRMNLNLANTNGLQQVDVKRLKVFINKAPELTQSTETTAPSYISLDYGETVVLTYKFDKTIALNNKIYSHKYYSSKYLEPISAQVMKSFTFADVEAGEGLATLRLSVGRAHGKSLSPTIQVNGQTLNTRGDIIRGYDQNTRKQFFGTLEIPIDMSLLKDGSNKVRVTFSDDGGYISSVILQVNKRVNATGIGTPTASSSLRIFPNIVKAGQMITINKKNSEETAIFNINGEKIHSTFNNTIDTSSFPPGIYLAKNENYTSKLIVK